MRYKGKKRDLIIVTGGEVPHIYIAKKLEQFAIEGFFSLTWHNLLICIISTFNSLTFSLVFVHAWYGSMVSKWEEKKLHNHHDLLAVSQMHEEEENKRAFTVASIADLQSTFIFSSF